jgi:hypothetical protein
VGNTWVCVRSGRAKINLLFFVPGRSPVGRMSASFVFNDNTQPPAIIGVKRRYFEGRDGADFSEILAFLITKVKLFPRRDFPHFCCTPRDYLKGRWRSLLLRHDPADDLPSVDIDWIAFHLSRPPRSFAQDFPAQRHVQILT